MPGLGSIAPLPGVGGEGYQRLTPWPLNAYPPTNQRIPRWTLALAAKGLIGPQLRVTSALVELRVASALVDVAVSDRDGELVAIAVAVGQMLGYRHRAVAPAGAADRDHQMGLALGHILGQQEIEQGVQALQEFVQAPVAADEGHDALVVAGELAQVVLVMWVRQEAHVESQVLLAREARA